MVPRKIPPLLSERIAEAFFCGTGDTCEANINYYIRKKRAEIMNGILMIVIAIVVLGGEYLLYGRYLQNKWGIVPKAKTPAYEMEE